MPMRPDDQTNGATEQSAERKERTVDTRSIGFVDYQPSVPQPKIARLIGIIAVVLVLHCVTQFLLYRGRVIGNWRVADSDFAVFALPAIASATAYAVVFWRLSASRWAPWRAVVVFALKLGTVSFRGGAVCFSH